MSCVISPAFAASITDSPSVGSLGIPEQDLPKLNKSAAEKDWHRLPKKAGGGIQAYFEGFHYIHCLVRFLASALYLVSSLTDSYLARRT